MKKQKLKHGMLAISKTKNMKKKKLKKKKFDRHSICRTYRKFWKSLQACRDSWKNGDARQIKRRTRAFVTIILNYGQTYQLFLVIGADKKKITCCSFGFKAFLMAS